MRKFSIVLYSILMFSTVVLAQEDSLTAPVCNHIEEITSRTGTFRIEYVLGRETILNLKTMKGFLYNNGASRPYLDKYKRLRIAAYTSAGLGLGLVVTSLALKDGTFSPLGLAGYTMMIGGIVFSFNANGKFRLAIHEYNKNICGK